MAEQEISLSVERRQLRSRDFGMQLYRSDPAYNVSQRKERLPERLRRFSDYTAAALISALVLHSGCRFLLPDLDETAPYAASASITDTK